MDSDTSDVFTRNETLNRPLQRPVGRMNAKLQIGISSLVGVKRAEKLLCRFKVKRPDVELVYCECALDELHAMFKLGHANIIIVPHAAPIRLGADCLCLPLMLEQLVFVPRSTEREYWDNVDCVTVDDIATETFVLLPDKCGLTRTTQGLFAAQGHSIRVYDIPATSYQSMLNCVEASLCSGILPDSQVKGYHGVVVPIVDNGRPIAIEYIVCGRQPGTNPKLFTELWDCLLESRITLGHDTSGVDSPPPTSARPQNS